MEEYYHVIGFVFFWTLVSMSTLVLVIFLIYGILNFIGKHWKPLWNIIIFLKYKEDFLEWRNEKRNN